MKNKSAGSRLKLFDLSRSGKGISKNNGVEISGTKRFFTTFFDNVSKLLGVNIIMVLGNFPLIFLIIALAGYTQREVFLPVSDLWQNLLPVVPVTGAHDPAQMAILAVEGLQHQTLTPTGWTYAFFGFSALALFTFGCVNVGTAYILRNLAKGEPIFVWSDFLYAVKRNWKQALPFGIADLLISVLLPFNIYTLFTSLYASGGFFASAFLWANVILLLFWFMMRYYIYLQMVTFSLSVFKIIKNSAIFALLGLKRNLFALLGILVCVLFEVIFIFGVNGVLIPVAIMFPFLIMLAGCAYMKVYAAYFKIKDLMIDPYLAEHPESSDDAPSDDEPIMHDDVTEAERLEEIKRKNGIG